jgi:hypothetical protein
MKRTFAKVLVVSADLNPNDAVGTLEIIRGCTKVDAGGADVLRLVKVNVVRLDVPAARPVPVALTVALVVRARNGRVVDVAFQLGADAWWIRDAQTCDGVRRAVV